MADNCGCVDHPIKSKTWEHCRDCGKSPRLVGPISRRGLCADCGEKRIAVALTQIDQQEGEYYARWMRGRAKGLMKAARQLGEAWAANKAPIGGN